MPGAWCEVAVKPGEVIINYLSTVNVGQWGHLSFTPQETDTLIEVLQEAKKTAVQMAGTNGTQES